MFKLNQYQALNEYKKFRVVENNDEIFVIWINPAPILSHDLLIIKKQSCKAASPLIYL